MKRTEGYVTREISRRRRRAIRKMPGSSISGVSEEEKKKSSSAEDRGRALTFPPTTLLTIQFPNDPARPLKASSQRPSSQARFSTKFILLGLLGLGSGSLTSMVKGAPQNRDPTIGVVCRMNLCASESDSRAWRDQAPISLSQPDPNSRAISQTLSMARTRKRGGFRRGAWIPRKPAEVTLAWVATCPRNGTTNEPCSGR